MPTFGLGDALGPVVLVASAIEGVSARGHSQSARATVTAESATAEGDSDATDDLAAVCAVVTAPTGEPEAYVGSPGYLAAGVRLAAIAPPELRPRLEVYQGILAAGTDPERSDSELTTKSPAEIQNVIAEIKDYGAANG
jgi:hypothetical protein